MFLPPEPVGRDRPGESRFDPLWRRWAEAGCGWAARLIRASVAGLAEKRRRRVLGANAAKLFGCK